MEKQWPLATLWFNLIQVKFKKFNATIGKSDLSVTGVLENFYGFIFRTKSWKGILT
jgi:hypothetical protein